MTCYCHRCVPTAHLVVCSLCGEEVRWGRRGDLTAYLHRADADHFTTLGHRVDGVIESFRARQLEGGRIDVSEESEDEEEDIEAVQVHSTDLPLRGRIFVGTPDGDVVVAAVPGGARTLINLTNKVGWSIESLRFARGPYLGTKGGSLGISDMVRLVISGAGFDGTPMRAVASWRDAKSDGCWLLRPNVNPQRLGSRALSDIMKEAAGA